MEITKDRFKREVINVTCTLVAAIMSAFGMHYFVGAAHFAPAGLDGVATMIAYSLKVPNPAPFILALNLPLLCVAWFVLKKRYVIYTLLFTVSSSAMMFILESAGAPIFNGGVALDGGEGVDAGTGTDDDVVFDEGAGADDDIFTDLSGGSNECCGVDLRGCHD